MGFVTSDRRGDGRRLGMENMTNIGKLKRTFIGAVGVLTIGVTSGVASADDRGPADHPQAQPGKVDSKGGTKEAKAPADAKDAKDGMKAGQTVEIKVTEKGFEPANVAVKKGQPVTLVITRTTDKTCATEIVIDDYGIKTALPLNAAVKVSFTPKKAGELKYGCAMNKMVGGVLNVQ